MPKASTIILSRLSRSAHDRARALRLIQQQALQLQRHDATRPEPQLDLRRSAQGVVPGRQPELHSADGPRNSRQVRHHLLQRRAAQRRALPVRRRAPLDAVDRRQGTAVRGQHDRLQRRLRELDNQDGGDRTARRELRRSARQLQSG